LVLSTPIFFPLSLGQDPTSPGGDEFFFGFSCYERSLSSLFPPMLFTFSFGKHKPVSGPVSVLGEISYLSGILLQVLDFPLLTSFPSPLTYWNQEMQRLRPVFSMNSADVTRPFSFSPSRMAVDFFLRGITTPVPFLMVGDVFEKFSGSPHLMFSPFFSFNLCFVVIDETSPR